MDAFDDAIARSLERTAVVRIILMEPPIGAPGFFRGSLHRPAQRGNTSITRVGTGPAPYIGRQAVT